MGGFCGRDPHHFRRAIGGGDMDAVLCQPEGIFPRAAGQFQDVVAGLEMTREVLPDARPQPLPQL